MVRSVCSLLVSLALLLWVWSANAAGVLNEAAQRHFDAGLAYVDDPNGPKWEEALKEFRAAYAESPTWKLMNNIGLCALNLERDGEAIEAFKQYLAHGGETDLNSKARKQIEKDVAMLSASLVTVSIEVEPPEATLVDERRNSKGETLVNRYSLKHGKAMLGVHPGHHQISVEASGYVRGEWSFDAEPSSTHQRQFKLIAQSAPPPVQELRQSAPGRDLTGTYIGLGTTAFFAAAAAVTGVLTVGTAREFDQTNDPDEEDRLRRSGRTLALLTDIGAGAAILSAGVTTVLYVYSGKSEQNKRRVAGGTRIVPVASPTTFGIAVSSGF